MTACSFKQRHFSKLLAAAAVSTILLLSGCNDETKPGMDYNKHIKRGESYLQQGQFNAAIIEAKNALQKAPEDANSHLLMADILLKLGQPKLALDQLENIQERTNTDYLLTKAEAYNAQHKFHSAEKLLNEKKALLTSTDNHQYLKLAAQAQLGLGNSDRAEALLHQLLTNFPDNADALVDLATIASIKKDFSLTTKYLDKALEKDPNNTQGLVLKARTLYANKDISGAEDTLTIALSTLKTTDRITPQRATILTLLAEILTQQGRSSEALIYTKILAEALPGQTELNNKVRQALNLFSEGELTKSEILLEEVIAEAPHHHTAGQILGILKYNRGELEAANQYFINSVDPEIAPANATMAFAMTNMRLNNPQKVVEMLDPTIDQSQNAQLLGLYGLAAISAEQFDKAETAINKALTIEPQKSRLRLALANMYNQQNLTQKGLLQLQEAYKTSPEDPYVQKALVTQYLSLKQNKNADNLIKDITNKYSANSSSLILIGTYQSHTNDNQSAIKTLQKALKLDPGSNEASSALGAIYLRNNDLVKATEHYRQMIKSLPNQTTGYKGLITALELQQKQHEAIDELLNLAKTDATPALYSVLIEFHARNIEFKKAHKLLSTAQQLFPEDVSIQNLPVRVAFAEATYELNRQQTSDARDAIMKGLQTDPSNIRLQTLLVNTEIIEKNYSEAHKLADQIAVNNGHLAMLLKGNISTAEKKYSIALNHYQTLWKNAPSDSLAQRIYANLSIQEQSTTTMSGFLKEWATAFPDSLAMLTSRGTLAINNKDYNNAIENFEKALNQQPANPSPTLLNNLAWVYSQTGKNGKAEKLAEQAYSLAPNNADIADTYGWILHKAGNKNKAKELLKTARELAPDNKEIEKHWIEANEQ